MLWETNNYISIIIQFTVIAPLKKNRTNSTNFSTLLRAWITRPQRQQTKIINSRRFRRYRLATHRFHIVKLSLNVVYIYNLKYSKKKKIYIYIIVLSSTNKQKTKKETKPRLSLPNLNAIYIFFFRFFCCLFVPLVAGCPRAECACRAVWRWLLVCSKQILFFVRGNYIAAARVLALVAARCASALLGCHPALMAGTQDTQDIVRATSNFEGL